jgi:hypothetical protein
MRPTSAILAKVVVAAVMVMITSGKPADPSAAERTDRSAQAESIRIPVRMK